MMVFIFLYVFLNKEAESQSHIVIMCQNRISRELLKAQLSSPCSKLPLPGGGGVEGRSSMVIQ